MQISLRVCATKIFCQNLRQAKNLWLVEVKSRTEICQDPPDVKDFRSRGRFLFTSFWFIYTWNADKICPVRTIHSDIVTPRAVLAAIY